MPVLLLSVRLRRLPRSPLRRLRPSQPKHRPPELKSVTIVRNPRKTHPANRLLPPRLPHLPPPLPLLLPLPKSRNPPAPACSGSRPSLPSRAIRSARRCSTSSPRISCPKPIGRMSKTRCCLPTSALKPANSWSRSCVRTPASQASPIRSRCVPLCETSC